MLSVSTSNFCGLSRTSHILSISKHTLICIATIIVVFLIHSKYDESIAARGHPLPLVSHSAHLATTIYTPLLLAGCNSKVEAAVTHILYYRSGVLSVSFGEGKGKVKTQHNRTEGQGHHELQKSRARDDCISQSVSQSIYLSFVFQSRCFTSYRARAMKKERKRHMTFDYRLPHRRCCYHVRRRRLRSRAVDCIALCAG